MRVEKKPKKSDQLNQLNELKESTVKSERRINDLLKMLKTRIEILEKPKLLKIFIRKNQRLMLQTETDDLREFDLQVENENKKDITENHFVFLEKNQKFKIYTGQNDLRKFTVLITGTPRKENPMENTQENSETKLRDRIDFLEEKVAILENGNSESEKDENSENFHLLIEEIYQSSGALSVLAEEVFENISDPEQRRNFQRQMEEHFSKETQRLKLSKLALHNMRKYLQAQKDFADGT